LGNVIAGISLLLYRLFQVGDRVQVSVPTGLEIGVVENLTLGYTTLKTYDNRRVVVPNSAMDSQVTINLTTKDPRVMAVVPIGIGYNAGINKARQILVELAKTHPRVEEVVDYPVTQLGNYTVVLSLRVWCEDSVTALQVEYDIYEQVKSRFDKEGIEIPFPYTNVVLKKEG
jgi:small conductance mechanosensitive channel